MIINGQPVNIRYRIGNEYDGDPETKTYRNATFAEAVAALQGTHEKPVPSEGGYHRSVSVFVVAAYAQDHTTTAGFGRSERLVPHKTDEPVFGFKVQVHGKDTSFGSTVLAGCRVSMASSGTEDISESRIHLALYTLAINLAEAANAEPDCSECAGYVERRKARMAIPKKV